MTEQIENTINGAQSIMLKGSEGHALAPLTKMANVAGLEETIFAKTDHSFYWAGSVSSDYELVHVPFGPLDEKSYSDHDQIPIYTVSQNFYVEFLKPGANLGGSGTFEDISRLYLRKGDACFWDGTEWIVLSGMSADEVIVKAPINVSVNPDINYDQLIISGSGQGTIKILPRGNTGDILTMKGGRPTWVAPENSGVTADTYGPTEDASPNAGETFSVPSFTVDAKGRVTDAATRTVTLPTAYTHPTDGLDDTRGGTAVTFEPTNTSYSTTAALLRVTVNDEGHVTGATEPAFTIDFKNLGIFYKVKDESNNELAAANPSGVLNVKGALKVNSSDSSLHVDVDVNSGLQLNSSKAISINRGTGLYVSSDHKLCADLHYTVM